MTPSADPAPIPEITRISCARCRTEIAGLNGRYACSGCGWVNHHSEGFGALPAPEDDPDYGRR